jgi:SOS response regulatory protein OraA/RecX
MKMDTSPSMAKKYQEMLMERSGEERLAMGFSMSATCRTVIIQAIQRMYPRISPVELKKKLFMRYYGREFSPEQIKKIFKHFEDTTNIA